jgi:hypothetical protein
MEQDSFLISDSPSGTQQILASFVESEVASFVESEVWSTNLTYAPKSIQDNFIVLVYMNTFNTRVEDGSHA